MGDAFYKSPAGGSSVVKEMLEKLQGVDDEKMEQAIEPVRWSFFDIFLTEGGSMDGGRQCPIRYFSPLNRYARRVQLSISNPRNSRRLDRIEGRRKRVPYT